MITSLWRTWFTVEEPISQRRFVTHGAALVVAKHAGDQALVVLAGGHPFGPGRTRLEGRTGHRMSLAAEGYWAAWGDWFIHRILGRVLTHVQRMAEAEVRLGPLPRG